MEGKDIQRSSETIDRDFARRTLAAFLHEQYQIVFALAFANATNHHR